jgi:hypothetical protein
MMKSTMLERISEHVTGPREHTKSYRARRALVFRAVVIRGFAGSSLRAVWSGQVCPAHLIEGLRGQTRPQGAQPPLCLWLGSASTR